MDLGWRFWTTTPLAILSTGCRTKVYGLRGGILNQQRSIFFQWRPESKIKVLAEAEALSPGTLTVLDNLGM